MDAHTTALALLSRRELSVEQLRARLARRRFNADDIESVIERLLKDGSIDDRRVALAAARLESAVRHRGRRRALQRVQQLGIRPDIAKAAVDEVFAEVDEAALLDRALDKALKGGNANTLDSKGTARVVRRLVGQGFDAGEVYARLRARGGYRAPNK